MGGGLKKKKKTPFWSEKKIYIFLCLVAGLLYFRWVNFDVFSYGDWSYKYTQNLKEMLSGSAWITNTDFGSFNELLWRAPLDFLFGVFAALGATINVSEKILVFWPIAITSTIAPYFLLRQLSFSKLHAVLGALFYATNTYFLSINPQGHGLLILAGNLLTLSFAFFVRGLDKRDTPSYIYAAILLWLTSVADFRLFYIGAMLFAGYVLYRWLFVHERPSKQLIGFGVLTILLQLGWLLATAMAQAGGSDAILSRSLFGGGYWDLASALTLHYPFWTGQTTSWFIVNDAPLYFWLIPIAVIASLYVNRKNSLYIFFGVIAALGILLSKQTNEPFTSLYPFLYGHLPGFSAFRESTKFYYFIILGYTVLITALLAYLSKQDKKILYKYAVTGVALLAVVNSLPYLTGSMGKLVSKASVPNDYQIIAKKLESDNSYYRTLWVPIAPRWSYYSTDHPRVSSTSLTRLPISSPANNQTVKTAQQLKDLINAPLFPHYISQLSVKYVVVPLRDIENKDDFYKFYGDDKQFYVDTLDKMSFLKRIDIGTKDVVVYQNSSYVPYVSATDSLTRLSSENNLDANYSFLKSYMKQDGSFAIEPQSNLPLNSQQLTNLFSDITPSNLAKGTITQQTEITKKGQLYVAQPKSQVSYTVQANTLTVQHESVKSNVSIDGTPAHTVSAAKKPLATAKLQKDTKYFISFNGTLAPIATSDGTRLLGESNDKAISIIASADKNLISNGSFESGLWQKKVADCNPYDNNPSISMSLLEGSAYDGKKALRLRAASHTACTDSPPANVKEGKTYLLSFRYRAPYAERISYQINFDNGKRATYSAETQTGSSQWRIHRQMITVPEGATNATVQLHGLPLPNYNNANFLATTIYDTVSLQESTQLASATIGSADVFTKSIEVPAGSHTFVYKNDSISNKNMFYRGNFEEGLWQEEVDDCASDIDDLEPVIGMRSSSGASDSSKSLELSAQRHVACTNSRAIKVQEGQAYLLSFDHQSPNTKSASYSVSFNDEQKTTIGEYVATTKKWQSYSKSILVPVGASELTVKVYARSYSDTPQATVNRYDNFSLLKTPDPSNQYYLLEQPSAGLSKPSRIEFKTSRAQKEVTIYHATKPFYLLMGEAYNSGWVASLRSNPGSALKHFKANDFQNAWYVDPAALCASANSSCNKQADGSYNIQLAIGFAPQKWFAIGTMVSIVTLGGCIVYLVVRAVRSRGEDGLYYLKDK